MRDYIEQELYDVMTQFIGMPCTDGIIPSINNELMACLHSLISRGIYLPKELLGFKPVALINGPRADIVWVRE
jgi:hypothetical protein